MTFMNMLLCRTVIRHLAMWNISHVNNLTHQLGTYSGLELTDETNLYAARERQQNPPPGSAPIWTPVTTEDMRAFVGLCFAMGVLRLPSRNDYWRLSNWLMKTNFGRVIPRDKFNLNWRYLHLANNDAPVAQGDNLVKIR